MGVSLDGGSTTIFQVKIKLLGVAKPPVWRRLWVPADIRLDLLHEVVQAAMGWTDTHMHVFTTGWAEYGLADEELGHDDERSVTLAEVADQGRMRYTYDFGDDWEHDIVVEDVLRAEPHDRLPVCRAGKGACPPEDCGGRWGYASLREVIADPAHEEHEAMLEWLGLDRPSEFDPAHFDIDAVNRALAGVSAFPTAGR